MAAVRRPDASLTPSPRQQRMRALVRRESLKAAGVSALPVAGIDLFVNARLLARTIEQINLAYGLSAAQIAQLPQPLRTQVDDAVLRVGGYLIGRVVTQTLIIGAAKGLGMRLTAQQAAKVAPIAGQIASAALAGWMFKRLCDRHITQCEQVAALLPQLPAPATAAALAA
jgi:DNA-binding transcriptional regulator LsrR (DeoR family)